MFYSRPASIDISYAGNLEVVDGNEKYITYYPYMGCSVRYTIEPTESRTVELFTKTIS